MALLLAVALAAPGPLELNSDELSVVPSSHVATARGHVHATSAEMDVVCDTGRATYGSPSPGAPREIEALAATGHVHLLRKLDGLVADADQASWEKSTDTMTLSGGAVVERGRDVLRGERIVVLLASDRFEVEAPDVTLVRSEKGPAHVSATHLSVEDGGRHARFDGDVKLHQAEVGATADRLDAALDGSGVDTRTLSSLVLTGHAHLTNGAMTGDAKVASYDQTTGDLVLEGAPRVTSRGDVVEGERIVVDGRTGEATVTRAALHVKAGR